MVITALKDFRTSDAATLQKKKKLALHPILPLLDFTFTGK
jgi:hypothetical protein